MESATLTAVRFTARDGAAKVSVRVMLPGGGQEQVVRALQRDIEAVKELGSGNMPRVLHQDFSGRQPWIVQDAVAWERAERHVEARGRPLGENEILRFLEDSARIIAPLHERGLAHRGIRAESVYFKEGGHAALALPAWEADLEGQAPDLFKSPYEAPEYLPGRANPRTDMYALGVTALRLVTGLRGPGLAAAARNPAAHKDRFGLTKGTFDILCALLADSTAKRVASGGQLLELLGKLDPTHSFGPTPGAGGGGARGASMGAGVPIEGAERHAARPGEPGAHGAGESTGSSTERDTGKDEERKKKAGWAALLAALLLVPAFLRKVLEQAAAQPSFQVKLLVALGLAATAAGGGVYASRQMSADTLGSSPIPHALPSAIVGHDDRPVPAAPDAGLWARLQALLPPPATRAIVAEASGSRLEAGAPGSPDPVVPTSPGSAGVPPAAPGRAPAPDNTPAPGKAPAPGNALAPTPPARKAAAPDGPYDPVAEPGTDPEDASGLTKQSRFFIRVNKTYKTLTLYQDGQYVTQYIVAIGAGANTPDGRYTVRKKINDPSYENIPPGDSRNPLGTRWLGMDVRYPGGRSIGIHGTNNDSSIGRAVSGGCIRMKNADAEQLYDLVPEGTPVEIN